MEGEIEGGDPVS